MTRFNSFIGLCCHFNQVTFCGDGGPGGVGIGVCHITFDGDTIGSAHSIKGRLCTEHLHVVLRNVVGHIVIIAGCGERKASHSEHRIA